MQTESARLKEWEQAEIERSTLEASLTEDEVLLVTEKTLQRYFSPPAETVYPLEYAYYLLGDVRGKQVLDLGCGNGENTILLVNRGAEVSGVDISESLIKLAERRMTLNGFAKGFKFFISSAHELPFHDESFDVVFGMAILHHLDLELTSREVWRVLRPGGYAVFKEPVRNSKIFTFLRNLIPYRAPDVSPFERPLTDDELETFARRYREYHNKSFQLPYVNLADVLPIARNYFGDLLRIDYVVLERYPFLRRFATSKVVKMVK